MSFTSSDPPQNQMVNIERLRKPRRKHKNSKLGCVQCKERRMKCDEDLPQCKNCRIRQVKIPCSYLSFTEEQKVAFLDEKRKQKALQTQDSPILSPLVSLTSTPADNANGITLRLVRHESRVVLKSQAKKFLGETNQSLDNRLFYTRLVSSSFLKYNDTFSNQLTLGAHWLYMQIRKKLENTDSYDSTIDASDLKALDDFTYNQKASTLKGLQELVSNLIKAQEEKKYREALGIYSNFTLPTISLGCLDLLSKDSLKSYYIEGSLAILKELYTVTEDSSPVASFIVQSISHTLSALFIPEYDFDVLFEIYEVLNEFGPTIRKEDDEILSMHYSKLVQFFDDYLVKSPIKLYYSKSYVTAYPPDMLYAIYNQFNKILPSEVFTINSMDRPVHRVFYSFYYMIGRVLDNIFPETRYLTQYRFIGPTTVYPFQREDVYGKYLPPDLVYFANFSLRLLSFFTRRMDFFNQYMKIMNPFPEKLTENRFHSRKTKKVKEVQITNFRSSILRPWNYPQVAAKENQTPEMSSYQVFTANTGNSSSTDESPASTGSFSTNFNSLFSMDNLTDVDTMNFEFNESRAGSIKPSAYVDLFDVNVETGLLNLDYDPLVKDWRADPERGRTGPLISITKHLEDRTVLMKEFSENSSFR